MISYLFEAVINFLSMGKPDKKIDFKWFPLLLIVIVAFAFMTKFYGK